MNTNEFIKECNQSPILKDFTPIGKKILHELNFYRNEYELNDMNELKEHFFFAFPQIIHKEKDPEKMKHEKLRNMQHMLSLLAHEDKILIKKIRKDLKMPFDYKGFASSGKPILDKNYVNILLSGLNKEYREWLLQFIDDELEYNKSLQKKLQVANALDEKISRAVSILLKKWSLSSRYRDALVELILFNRIIPADPNITFRSNFIFNPKEKWRSSIDFDVDTTKEELLRFIKDDPFRLFSGNKKVIAAKTRRTSRKDEEKKEMIREYNTLIRDGKNDKYAFTSIKRKFGLYDLSLSAIRKRIKGK